MIKNLIFDVYLLISYFITNFLLESRKTNKTGKNDPSFHETVSPKKPHSFYEPELTHYKEYTPATQPKTFLVGVRKSICTAPFLGAQELHSRSTWKVNVCIFL